MCIRFVCFRFCLLCSKQESEWHCLRGKQYNDVIHSFRNLEMACCTVGIYDGNSSTNTSQHLAVTLRTVQRIRKILNEFNDDYEGMAVWKPHSDRSDRKRTSDFVGKIQAMIDKDPRRIIDSIATDVGVPFCIRQIVLEDVRYFLYKRRMGQLLSQVMKDKRKNRAAKLFNELTYYLQQGDPQKGLKEIPKTTEGRGWSSWRFLWINSIDSILRYFHLILVNKFDKMRCHCNFHFWVILTIIYLSHYIYIYIYIYIVIHRQTVSFYQNSSV